MGEGGVMLGFHTIFPDVASKECRTVTPFNDGNLPGRTFLFMEAYCPDRGCDCRRVMINVVDADRREQVATINHGFEPPKPPFEDEGQTFLDPLNPQRDYSPRFLEIFRDMIERDQEYATRLQRHYQMFKRVVEDPAHPAQAVLRSARPAAPGDGIFPAREPVRRDGPKVGANDACPCGSGRKYKRCCRN
jgi:hypothetical protein